ncbi:recombinase family protein [Ahrensia sp. R2A130]|uniref:recombinase family protein n=1 Tax=Ahrensia sp. R2A130 TaxID=744979 RepID=UPI0001E0C34D|nr:recombinase family protein [Ahrensia sp. R2A130]EFL89426.1 site-specific recombinase [Ahrensia sp. R2A130]
MSIAVIYTRVSSKAQLKKGDGLASQEQRCREFASYKGYDVVEVFRDEGVSGGIANRPAIKAMLKWLRQNRVQEPVVLIDDISRIARSIEAHWKLRAAIGSVGAKLESPSIEFGDDSDSQLVENMLVSVSQHQRQKNGEQVVNRMKARLLNGYFPFWVPTGYRYERVKGHSGKMIVRDEPHAALIQEALEGFATGRFQTQIEVKRFLEPHSIFARDKNGEIHPQRIANLLANKIYAGYYEYKPWNVPLTNGKHEALISWETFQRIQTRLQEGAVIRSKRDAESEFPLKGFVTCWCCEKPLTAYYAKGRNKRYPYYECFNKQCDERRKSIRKNQIESEFETLVKSMRPQTSMMVTVSAMFRDLWNTRLSGFEMKRMEQKKALTGLKTKMSKLTDRLIETTSASVIKVYEAKLEQLETEKALITENLANRPDARKDFDEGFRTAMNFLANPWKLWVSNNPIHRQTLIKLVFAAPLPYRRN